MPRAGSPFAMKPNPTLSTALRGPAASTAQRPVAALNHWRMPFPPRLRPRLFCANSSSGVN